MAASSVRQAGPLTKENQPNAGEGRVGALAGTSQRLFPAKRPIYSGDKSA